MEALLHLELVTLWKVCQTKKECQPKEGMSN